MGEEFYCVIKLISGEEIFSLISIDENDGDPIIVAQNPLSFKIIHNSNGSLIKVKPWMELTSDDVYLIKYDKVITMTETNDKRMIDIYNDYVENDSIDFYKPTGQVEVSTDMGYVATVEESREKLERLFNQNTESKDI